MKSLYCRLSLMLALAGTTLVGGRTSGLAGEEDQGGPRERLDRLEQRLNELAERQEQLMRRIRASPEQQGPMPQPRPQGMPQTGPQPGPQGTPQTMPQPGPHGMPQPMSQPGSEGMRQAMPQSGPQGPGASNVLHEVGGLIRLMFLVGILCNVLLSVWIYTDIRKRGEGSGLFIALALLAGVPAAIIYALVRIGDKKASPPSSTPVSSSSENR